MPGIITGVRTADGLGYGGGVSGEFSRGRGDAVAMLANVRSGAVRSLAAQGAGFGVVNVVWCLQLWPRREPEHVKTIEGQPTILDLVRTSRKAAVYDWHIFNSQVDFVGCLLAMHTLA